MVCIMKQRVEFRDGYHYKCDDIQSRKITCFRSRMGVDQSKNMNIFTGIARELEATVSGILHENLKRRLSNAYTYSRHNPVYPKIDFEYSSINPQIDLENYF